MNSCNLTGRLTADPTLKSTQNGVSVCSFTLAVKRPRVKDTTDFINCTAWRASAEYLCSYGRKGAMVEVTGALTSRKYEDNDGNQRTAFEVVADNLGVLESRSNASGEQVAYHGAKASQNESSQAYDNPFIDFDNASLDEVPF
jgi:single-strand DNA-binding protein